LLYRGRTILAPTIQTITACKAGTDVYCREAHVDHHQVKAAVVEVAPRRSASCQSARNALGPNLCEAGGGSAGRQDRPVSGCRDYRSEPGPPAASQGQTTDPPPELNWDMWLGPRPARKSRTTITPYKSAGTNSIRREGNGDPLSRCHPLVSGKTPGHPHQLPWGRDGSITSPSTTIAPVQ